jgi:putative sterol carrier protein
MTNLELYRGDNKTYNLNFTDSNGDVIDITGYTIYFTIKNKKTYKLENNDNDALVKINVTIHTNPTQGESQINITSDLTNDIEPNNYIYDIQLKDSSDNILTIISGNINIIADVTRRVN